MRNFLSVVVPCYNESGNIKELYQRLQAALHPLDIDQEYLFVDDGSTDDSLVVLSELRSSDPCVKIISLSRNFGPPFACTAGLDHAIGDAVVTMDGDLQHPPELVPELWKKWREGFDVVYTLRQYSHEAGFFKRASSKLFSRIFQWLSDTDLPHDTSDFRLLSRKAVDTLKTMRERYRFPRGLVSWIGFRQTFVTFKADSRKGGKSKYSFIKLVHLALDSILSFSSIPLYASTLLGFAVSIYAFLYSILILYLKYWEKSAIPGWTTIVLAVLFLGGTQLICIGIMGEYIGRMYNEIKRRPLYVIKETLGVNPPANNVYDERSRSRP